MIYKGGGVSKKERDEFTHAIRRNVIESMQVNGLFHLTRFTKKSSCLCIEGTSARSSLRGPSATTLRLVLVNEGASVVGSPCLAHASFSSFFVIRGGEIDGAFRFRSDCFAHATTQTQPLAGHILLPRHIPWSVCAFTVCYQPPLQKMPHIDFTPLSMIRR